MATNRKGAEEFILGFMQKLTKGGYNKTIYEGLFKRMNNEQFKEFIDTLDNGGSLCVWIDNFDVKESLNWDNLLKVCSEYGFDPETRLVFRDKDTGIKTISPVKYVVGIAEVRKQRQLLMKKLGYSKDDSKIDDLTGQVIGDSRGGGLSNPEVGVLAELGLTKTVQELYNVKGGDLAALKAYKNELITTGTTTMEGSLRQGDGVKSLKTVQSIFRGRMLDNNFGERD